uniref:Integrase core domain containing protein n=1 Tax=Solanum tuberosum TaxID=4113 RepID=M1DRT7_SOLTU
MAKMMTQMTLLSKHVMVSGYESMNLTEAKFENKEIHIVSRLEEGSRSSSLRLGGNQGWNIISEDGWRHQDRDWSDRNRYWKKEDDDNACYSHTGDSLNSRDSPGSFQVEDLLSHILNKVEGSNEVLTEMNADFSSLNKTVNSHSASIKQLESQMIQLSAQLDSKPKEIRCQ